MNEPYIIFQKVFGSQWNDLPSVMHQHYKNRAYTNDITIMEGLMTIKSSPIAKLISPIFRLIGTLVPYEDTDIPVTVTARSCPNTAQYMFDREFRFKNRKPYKFISSMEQVKDNEVIEFMRFGIGWRSSFSWTNEKVILKHRGYSWRVFGIIIPLPVTWLMGCAYAEEVPISDSEFKMTMNIKHPLWGTIYQYYGTFKVIEN